MVDPTLPQQGNRPTPIPPVGPVAPNPALVEFEAKQGAETQAMNERHAKETADLTAANADAAALTAAKDKQQAEAAALTNKHAKEIAAVPDANPSPDNIALPQPLAAPGPLALNGPAAAAGVVTLTHRRRVVITSAGDDRGINWTVTGTTKPNGPVVTDTFAGANAADVRSSKDFLTVTSVSGSGPSADAVSVGVAALPPLWEPLDEGAVLAVAQAMAMAFHGPDVEDANGYLQPARSFVAAQRALGAYVPPKKPVPAPAPSPAPVQGTLAPAPKPTVGASGSGVASPALASAQAQPAPVA